MNHTALTNEQADVQLAQGHTPLRNNVETTVARYLKDLSETCSSNVYKQVLAEVEEPLLEAILKFTRGNQSRAARLLGVSRGTLRKKMKQYELL